MNRFTRSENSNGASAARPQLEPPVGARSPLSGPLPEGHRTPSPASAAKLAANRANAQHSTGPKTEEGKARVSHNAFKHGLDFHQIAEEELKDRAQSAEQTRSGPSAGGSRQTLRLRCHDVSGEPGRSGG